MFSLTIPHYHNFYSVIHFLNCDFVVFSPNFLNCTINNLTIILQRKKYTAKHNIFSNFPMEKRPEDVINMNSFLSVFF